MKRLIIPTLIFLIAILYRGKALTHVHPFWVDEFSTAYQSSLVLEHGLNVLNHSSFERQNITTHFSIALSYLLFGKSEQTTRLPILLFGAVIPVMIYLLCEEMWKNKYISIPAALFTLFSYFQIAWSVQARGYALQQFFLLLSVYLSLRIVRATKWKNLLKFAFFTVLFLGFITHWSFIFVVLLYAPFLFIGPERYQLKSKTAFICIVIAVILIFLITGKVSGLIFFYLQQLVQVGLPNNVWYYHSFLWRQYPFILLMSVFGLLLLMKEKKKYPLYVFMVLPIYYLIFFCFIYRPYSSRYLLAIFPFFFILSAYFLYRFGETFFKAKYLGVLIAIFIIINGNKFVTKPKSYYSINHDMREIANVDYNQVYGLIKDKSKDSTDKVAVIDTWHDRARWYLGNDYDGLYLFSWLDTDQYSNGMALKTSFEVNDKDEKYVPSLKNFRLIGELSDLQKAMGEYKKGFIWIDDTALPEDVTNYVKNNFCKELSLDHYPLDDNPYSIWPGTLYSWGFESLKP